MTQERLHFDINSILEKKGFIWIAGPCVLESIAIAIEIARVLKEIAERLSLPFIFKASYDKANRSSHLSYRGPGIEKGLEILNEVRTRLNIPILSDVHSEKEVEKAARVLDVIQIPAFLCRQTDLIIEAAKTGKTINLKKGQFMSPWEMKNALEKVWSTGNKNVFITERGYSFGYQNLVVDMRAIDIMKGFGVPVIFDATHSVQIPGGGGTCSSGDRRFVPILARAAVATGADGIFMEVYPEPDKARCDGPNSWPLKETEGLMVILKKIHEVIS